MTCTPHTGMLAHWTCVSAPFFSFEPICRSCTGYLVWDSHWGPEGLPTLRKASQRGMSCNAAASHCRVCRSTGRPVQRPVMAPKQSLFPASGSKCHTQSFGMREKCHVLSGRNVDPTLTYFDPMSSLELLLNLRISRLAHIIIESPGPFLRPPCEDPPRLVCGTDACILLNCLADPCLRI